MLTQIRNALMVRKAEVVLPHSNFKQQLAELLARQGLIEETSPIARGDRKFLQMKLRYVSGKPAIAGIKRVSTPGQRRYSRSTEIPRTLNGYGMTIVSTSRGLLTDKQARKEHLGGEVICQIW